VYDKRLTLDLNTAIVYNMLGDQQQALTLYRSALATAESLGAGGEQWLGALHTNIGNVYDLLGDFRQALAYHERARTLFAERNEIRAVAVAEHNIGHIAMAQGHYRQALQLLHRAHDLKADLKLPLDVAYIKRDIVECYLLLNRFAEARELAQQVREEFRAFGAVYEEALTLLHLASAEAELARFDAAQAALDAAEPIFSAVEAHAWVATTKLRRGRLALRRGDPATAAHEALAAAAQFEAGGQRVEYANATLLHGQVTLAQGQLEAAARAGASALEIARRVNVPPLRYSAHLLLGQVAQAQGAQLRALRRYRAAVATVDRVQRGLTLTLRAGFLEDKGEALHTLIGLHLRAGQAAGAFETLERAKSQILLGYLANRDQLRWADDDARSRALIAELNRLREEHQWFYRLAHEPASREDGARSTVDPQQAGEQVAARERRMRAITEQLYLQGAEGSSVSQVRVPTPDEVQRSLDDDTLLIEFYNDGAKLWAFSLDARGLEVHTLPATVAEIDRLLAQLQVNLAAALKVGAQGPGARNFSSLAQRLGERLYAMLLAPLTQRLRGRRRLVVVPYGALHYLPFQLLHNGAAYLIEEYELVVLPAAGLATRRSPRRAGGALALAHSWQGRLPEALSEARLVQELLGGQLATESAARRTLLEAAPTRVLHIAAHGEHRLDQPDLSFIQLADGQLYSDDLLQHDLSYELVTLSACETGRARVAAGDELIGLGRGFLYAGAGALIASMWRVADETALELMGRLYAALRDGASKAAALREAQRGLIAERPGLHPAFWGPFQLVGDARPLSHCDQTVLAPQSTEENRMKRSVLLYLSGEQGRAGEGNPSRTFHPPR
jgi:CHAT domain-containing protein